MSLIITDGNYLLADHRTVIDQRPLVVRKLGEEIEPDNSRRVVDEDNYEKIKLAGYSDLQITDINANRVVAIATSGHLRMIQNVYRHMNNLAKDMAGKTIDFRKFKETVTSFFGPNNLAATFVFVFSNGTVRSFGIGGRNHNIQTIKFRGDLTIIGTSAGFIKPLLKLGIDKLPIQEIFGLAPCVDGETSFSYSVYGVQENHYYRSINPNKEVCRARFKEIMKDLDYTKLMN